MRKWQAGCEIKMTGARSILGKPDEAASGRIDNICKAADEQAFSARMQYLFYRASAGQMQNDALLALPHLHSAFGDGKPTAYAANAHGNRVRHTLAWVSCRSMQ